MLRPAKYLRPTPRKIRRYRQFLVTLFVLGTVLAAMLGPTSNMRARASAPEADQAAAAEDAELQAARRSESVNNLKVIMIAMHNYHDTLKSFPPAFTSNDGKPLLSWRVALLPYLEDADANAVWMAFHLDEPWDGEHNKPLVAKMPQIYRSPASKLTDGRTVYLTPRGPTTVFPGEIGISIRKISDGTSNTIAVLEVDDKYAVPWTKPVDWTLDPDHPKIGLGGQFPGGSNAAFCDGSVHFLNNSLDEKVMRALFTISGREALPPLH